LEAEKAKLGGPIVIVKDKTASNGAFVWDPDRPAKLRGSPGEGRVVFLVQVAADTVANISVRTWATSIANDSYFLGVVPGKASEGPTTDWLFLTHRDWTWVQRKQPIKLTKGVNSIIFMTREEKSRLDAIRISPLD